MNIYSLWTEIPPQSSLRTLWNGELFPHKKMNTYTTENLKISFETLPLVRSWWKDGRFPHKK
jgi:hypothetical protein